jgi:hypothetical protein
MRNPTKIRPPTIIQERTQPNKKSVDTQAIMTRKNQLLSSTTTLAQIKMIARWVKSVNHWQTAKAQLATSTTARRMNLLLAIRQSQHQIQPHQ